MPLLCNQYSVLCNLVIPLSTFPPELRSDLHLCTAFFPYSVLRTLYSDPTFALPLFDSALTQSAGISSFAPAS